MFLHSSLIRTTQDYVNQTHRQALNKIVVSLDHQLEFANKFHASISDNDKITKLIFDETSEEKENELAIALGQELRRLLSTTDFSSMYIYFSSKDLVVANNQSNSSQAFFDYMYRGTDFTYEAWLEQLQSPNLGNYINIHKDNGSFLEILYQLPFYANNSYVHATLVLRISDAVLKDQVGTEHITADVAILDRKNQVIMRTSDLPQPLSYDSYTDGAIITDKDMITICQTSSYNSWKYLYFTNNQDFSHKIQVTRRISITFILLSLIFCCGLGIYFSLRNYRPLNELIKTYKKQVGMTTNERYDYEIIKSALQDYVESKRNLNNLEMREQNSRISAYLTSLLKGTHQGTEDTQTPVSLPSAWFSVILFSPYNNETLFGEDDLAHAEVENTTFFIVQNVMGELLNQDDVCHFIKVDGFIAGIYCYNNLQNTQIYKNRIHHALAHGLSFIKSNFFFGCNVGISQVREGKSSLPLAYNEALLALNFYAKDSSRIVFYDEIYRKSLNAEKTFYDSFAVKNKNLLTCITNGDRTTALQVLSTIFQQCISSLDVEKAKIFLFTLENTILSVIDIKQNFSQTEVAHDILRSMNFDNLSETYTSLIRLVERACELSAAELSEPETASWDAASPSASANDLLPQIIDYVRDNFTDPSIDISSIGGHFHLSGYYISKLFKNAVGESIAAFIAQLRIDKAKALLESGGLSLQEVYLQCGFTNEKTFVRTFTKYEGITPAKYKKLNS